MSDRADSPATPPVPVGLHRFFVEFLWFGLKEARACLFAGVAGLKHIKAAIHIPE